MCVKSATSLSCLVSVAPTVHSPTTYLVDQKNEYRMPQGQSKFVSSIQKKEHTIASVWSTSQLTEAIRLYCENSFRSSADSFSSLRNIFLLFILVQMDFITNNFTYVSELMATCFTTSLKLHQIKSRQKIPNVTSDKYSNSSERSFQNNKSTRSSWDSSLSSSTTNDEDNLSMNSATLVSLRKNEDYVQAQLEEPLTPVTKNYADVNEDADEWGHFMDFQEFESLTTMNSMADPFQSLSKTLLRRRGAKISVCKLEQLQEEDSFVRESE